MKLYETRKEKGVEVANREYAKGGQRMADRWGRLAGRPRPVAILGGPFAQVQARSVLLQCGCFGDFSENLRPAGLV